MRPLPLYPSPPTTPLDTTPSKARNASCRDCKLGAGIAPGRGCTMPAGPTGAVLILGQYPGRLELTTQAGAFVRGLVARVFPDLDATPVLYDSATRCKAPSDDDLKDLAPSVCVDACRPYLVDVIERLKPSRILALGEGAVRAALGGDTPPLPSARRAYTYTRGGGPRGAGIPVFLLREPEALIDNPFLRAEWVDDFRWSLTASPRNRPMSGRAQVVETVSDAHFAARVCATAPWVAWDLETFGRAWDRGFKVISAAVCPAGSDDAFVWDLAALGDPAKLAPLLELLQDPDLEKTGMNGKYDDGAARCAWGIEVRGSGRDVGLERALMEPEALTRLEVQQWLVGMGGGKSEMAVALKTAEAQVLRMVDGAAAGQGALFGGDRLPPGVNLEHARANPTAYAYAYTDRTLCSRYNALDAVSTARLESRHQWMLDRPGNESLRYVWDELVRHVSPVIEQMEAWGVRVNAEAISALAAYLNIEQARVRARLELHGLHEPGSPDKVAEFLFGKLGLPAEYETAGGKPSTNEEALDAIKHLHPAVEDVLEWRGLDKVRGTYCEGLARQVTDDGRIHVNYDIAGARSGRMSARGGLHGLPRPETGEGKMVRNCFVAPPDHVLLEVDVSQAELRALAGLSGDPVMVAALNTPGMDYHQRTAEGVSRRVWNIEPEAVTSKHRSQAKIINLALIYGRGDAALAAEVTSKSGVPCSKEQAGVIREAVLGEIKVANAWMEAQREHAKRHGFARTWFRGKLARRRPLPAIGTPGNEQWARKARGNAERAAANTPVQGSNSDVVLDAIVTFVRALKRSGLRARAGLTVHDSLLIEAHCDDLGAVLALARRCFEALRYGEGEAAVRVVADAKVGAAYGSLAKAPSQKP